MKRPKILIIGKKSLLAINYLKYTKLKNTYLVNRDTLPKLNLQEYSHIINFSLNPKIKTFTKNYESRLDRYICNKIKNSTTVYIIPSTRLVYSNKVKSPLSEKSNIKNISNVYGKNKRKIEIMTSKILKQNFLILRIATILLFDTSKRDLFSSRILRNLKYKKKVYFDLNPSSQKDFITIEYLSSCIDKLIKKNEKGIFNISSGIPITVKEILDSIIIGFGGGKVIYKNINKYENYFLSNKKLKNKIKFSISKKYILKYCKNLGKNIKWIKY